MENSLPRTGYSSLELIRDLEGFVRPYRGRFWLATLIRFIGQIVWLYPPLALAEIVTFFGRYQPGESLAPILIIFVLWAAASVLHYIGEEIGIGFGYQVSERAALDAMFRTIQHLLLLDLGWHEKENSGNKLKRIQKGGEGIDKILRIWIDNTIESSVNFVGMILILAHFNLWIALATVFFLLTFFGLSTILTSRAGEASNVSNQRDEEASGLMFEMLNNVRSVKVLGMGTGLMVFAADCFARWYDSIRRRIQLFRLRQGILNLWAQTFRVGLTSFIVWKIARGELQIGFLVLFYNYFNYVWESISKMSNMSLDFMIAKYGIMRMKRILDEQIGIDSEEGKRAFPKNWQTINAKNLSFAYGSKHVLNDLSFTINRGERIGIVGLSGAGKSTLFKLLLKEYEDYDGEILIDDVPLRNISRRSLFDYTAVVLQDTEVFNFSLKDNIILASSKTSGQKKRLTDALTIAHVTDFLKRLPQGADTMIGEKGVKLSGGEKQRLGIARAVYKQPQLLFLDEATSHLDLESEEKIRDSLHRFFQSVTAIVIAHRLTTIREMDRILVIEEGTVKEEGSYEELMAKRGRFHELWELQKF